MFDPTAAQPDVPVTLTGTTLSIAQLVRVARRGARVALSGDAITAVLASADALDRHAQRGGRIYGMTTGVGALDCVRIKPEDARALQRGILVSHAAGVGAPMPDDQVRALMLTRVNALGRGLSGVRLRTLEALIAMIDCGVTPIVPEGGSVGASDLAPLAHVGLVLAGEGRARFAGEVLPGRAALARANIAPPPLEARDALALINGLSQTVGIGALAVHDARRLAATAELAAAMAIAANGSPREFLEPNVAHPKRHPAAADAAERLRQRLTAASAPSGALRAELSSRYAPSVLGIVTDALEFSERTVVAEMNAAIDNPLVGDDWLCSNAGGTCGQRLAQALDLLANAVTSLAVISQRRTAALLDVHHNGGLPPFLAPDMEHGGFGFMMIEHTAASLVAELRTRAVPASVQSIPVCAMTEDYASMSPLAARRAAFCVATAETVVAIELLVAAQALDLRGTVPPALRDAHRRIRAAVPMLVQDRVLADDIEAVSKLARSGAFGAIVS